MPSSQQHACSSDRSGEQQWTRSEQGAHFRVCSLHWDDHERHAAYQMLRARIFGEQFHWQVTVTADGREIDAYDQRADPTIQTHTIYRVTGDGEPLLGGVRTFTLRSWDASMVMHEFRAAGMFPAAVLATLQQEYSAEALLEVTRLCVQRRQVSALWTPFHVHVAQDLAYSAVYRVAEATQRDLVLAVVSTGYWRLLQHAGFVVQVYYANQHHHKTGYVLTIIDLVASIHRMRAAGKVEQVSRLLAWCQDERWTSERIREES